MLATHQAGATGHVVAVNEDDDRRVGAREMTGAAIRTEAMTLVSGMTALRRCAADAAETVPGMPVDHAARVRQEMRLGRHQQCTDLADIDELGAAFGLQHGGGRVIDGGGEHRFMVVGAEQHGFRRRLEYRLCLGALENDAVWCRTAGNQVFRPCHRHHAGTAGKLRRDPFGGLSRHVVSSQREGGVGEIDGHGETSHMT